MPLIGPAHDDNGIVISPKVEVLHVAFSGSYSGTIGGVTFDNGYDISVQALRVGASVVIDKFYADGYYQTTNDDSDNLMFGPTNYSFESNRDEWVLTFGYRLTDNEVLQLEPENPEAKKGLAELVRIEEQLAVKAFDRGGLQTSLSRIKAGLSIDATGEKLLALQRRVEEKIVARRQAQERAAKRVAPKIERPPAPVPPQPAVVILPPHRPKRSNRCLRRNRQRRSRPRCGRWNRRLLRDPVSPRNRP